MIGKRLRHIEPVYKVLKQIDTAEYRLGNILYTHATGSLLVQDQWGSRRVIPKDRLAEYEEVK